MIKIIVVVGPTASGKTGLGIGLAARVGGEVVSVDSRQVYRGMDIGTAKGKLERMERPERAGRDIRAMFGKYDAHTIDGIVHWGIDLADPDEEYSVAAFKKYADERIADIARRGRVPILVGGTGLWVRAVVDNLNLTETPPNPELRAALEARHLDDLFAEYKRLDPDGAEVIDRDNKRRVVRALEVTKTTGKPFSDQIARGEPKYDALQIGLLVDREELNGRIDARVDEMVARGLVNEVRRLRDAYGCAAESMTGIGYRQICRWLDAQPGTAGTLADAIEETKKATRAYAKRQMTWFKRDPRVRWIGRPEEADRLTLDFFGIS